MESSVSNNMLALFTAFIVCSSLIQFTYSKSRYKMFDVLFVLCDGYIPNPGNLYLRMTWVIVKKLPCYARTLNSFPNAFLVNCILVNLKLI